MTTAAAHKMHRSLAHLALLLSLFALDGAGSARAQTDPAPTAESTDPPTHPILRIETGMHTAPINRIGIDRAGRYLVTGSDDKTVRVWSLADGSLLRVLRPPIGIENAGRIHAVAVSPDGDMIACGVPTRVDRDGSNSIYLFDRRSGAILRRIAGLPWAIWYLSFSPDGRNLAATLGRRNGVRVFSVADGSQIMADKDYGGPSNGTDWDASGRLATCSADGNIRLYSAAPELKLVAKVRMMGGNEPREARFSPDGSRIAVSYGDTNVISVLSSTGLDTLYSPDVAGILQNGRLNRVCWSSNGHTLYAGGTASDASGHSVIRAWSDGGRGAYRDTPVADDLITDLRALPAGDATGTLVFAAGDPKWGVLDLGGHVRTGIGSRVSTADYRYLYDGFRLAADGGTVGFGFEDFGHLPTRFDVPDRSLTPYDPGAVAAASLASPVVETDGIRVLNWKNAFLPSLHGKRLAMNSHDMCRCLAIAPNGQRFLLGTKSVLVCFGADGLVAWSTRSLSDTCAVNVARNGSVCAAAFADGTIRWYRMRDGKELLDFFPHADRKRWVLWTPDGYYDCSPGGEDLIGWQVNRGVDQAADFFPASRFRDAYYRPDVIQLVLATLDDDEALRLANLAAGHKTSVAFNSIETRLPPVVTIVSPDDLSSASGGKVTVRFRVRTPDDAPVTAIRALVDGRPPDAARGLDLGSVAIGPDSAGVREIVVPVPARDCEVSILAENKNSSSIPASIRLKVAAEFVAKPKLYVLAIGVGAYGDTKDIPKLHFPAKDAHDFANALQRQAGGLYRAVEVKILTDAGATKEDIEDGLDWIQKQTTSKDVAAIFVSGHGDNDPSGEYGFLPQNFDPQKWKRTVVPYTDIQSTLRTIAGKALFFVDTCHSGNVDGSGALRKGAGPDINRVVNELSSAENGVIVFTASTGKQYALEDMAWGNGAFTKAVVEGLTGKADYQHTGRITVNMLDLYVSERVKELTGGRQTPTTAKPATVPDFPVASVK